MKLRNLIDVGSISSHIEMAKSFKDANGVLLAQSLTHLDPKIFQKLYPDNVFLNSGLIIDNTGGLANTIKKRRVSASGSFSDVSNRGANKGLISLNGEVDTIGVIGKETTINYTDDEIGQAKLENYNLVEKLLGAVDEVYRKEIDEILAIGNGLNKGLLNYAGFTADTAGVVTSLNGVQAFDAVAELIIDQWNGVNNTNGYMADRVIFPTTVMNTLASKKWKEDTSEKSVLTVLKEAFPTITFLSSWRANSVGGTSITVAYSTSENAMVVRIPQPLVIGKTIPDGSFGYRADAKYRIAGLDVAENKSARYLTGL
jgi:hypothetical protein